MRSFQVQLRGNEAVSGSVHSTNWYFVWINQCISVLCMCIFIRAKYCIVDIYLHIYIHIWRERERKRDLFIHTHMIPWYSSASNHTFQVLPLQQKSQVHSACALSHWHIASALWGKTHGILCSSQQNGDGFYGNIIAQNWLKTIRKKKPWNHYFWWFTHYGF